MRLVSLLVLLLAVLAPPAAAMKVNGQLEKALLEKLANDPAASTEARIYYNTGTKKAKIHNGTTWTELGSGTGTGSSLYDNMLANPGAETNLSDWTENGSGTFLRTTTAANVARGVGAFDFDPAINNDNVTSDAVAIPPGLYGRNGAATCKFYGGNGQTKLQVYDGSNVLVEQQLSSYSSYTPVTVNFIFPSSGSLSIRVIATTNTATVVYFDDCFLGDANAVNLGSVSQAKLLGTIKYAKTANCYWATTTSATYANFTADSDCATPTVTGSLTATPTKLPAAILSSAPAGEYLFIARGAMGKNGSTGQYAHFRFTDGTNNSADTTVQSSAFSMVPSISGRITMATAQSNVTLQMQGAGDGTTIPLIDMIGNDFEMEIYYFPSSSEQAIRIENADQFAGAYWSGGGTYTTTSATPVTPVLTGSPTQTLRGQATVGTSAATVEFTVPSLPAGKYFAYATGSLWSNSGTGGCQYWMSDGTQNTAGAFATSNTVTADTVNGLFTYTAQQTNIKISLKTKSLSGGSCAVDASMAGIEMGLIPITRGLPAPYLVGGLSTSSAGQMRVETAKIAAPSGGACAVTEVSGDWVNGNCTSSGTGLCTCTLNSGLFTGAVGCKMTITDTGSCTGWRFEGEPTSSGFSTVTYNTAGNPVNCKITVECTGPR